MRARLPWILFAVSLILNVFVVGGFLYTRHVADRPPPGGPVWMAARSLELDDAQKEAFRQLRAEGRRNFEEMRETMRPLRERLTGELAKPAPDFATVDRLIDEISVAETIKQKAMARTVQRFVDTLRPEQRAQFHRAVQEQVSRRFPEPGKPGRSRPEPSSPDRPR